jgi:hypothetical protein
MNFTISGNDLFKNVARIKNYLVFFTPSKGSLKETASENQQGSEEAPVDRYLLLYECPDEYSCKFFQPSSIKRAL